MRISSKLAILCTLTTLIGCHHSYVAPETPMPPNTILLSQMMRQVSVQPGFTDELLNQIDKGSKKGTTLLTPRLIDELRKHILGNDWQGLDRFPGWTMRRINPTIRAIGHLAAIQQAPKITTPARPGAPITEALARQYLNLGPYALDKSQTLSLDQPSTFQPFITQRAVTDLGDGVVRGDGPSDLAPEHAESERLADALNRLAANTLDGAQPFIVTTRGQPATTPEQLVAALAADGATVTVDDARYFANFAHLHYKGMDVMAPFWIDSQLIIPHTGGRHLLIPAAHAELEWHIHLNPKICAGICPSFNADVGYFFGIDGKAEWRAMDTLPQAWVLKRNAHEYTGSQAIEATRLAGLMTVAYMHLHAAHPELPFGGYYALGVCQDGVSSVELALTGHVTLFPNTADAALFNDPRDAEINALIAAIPKDRDGGPPQPARIFGSIPTTNFNTITIPGLAADLNATYAAWKTGHLNRSRSPLLYIVLGAVLLIGLFIVVRKSRSS